MCVCVCVCTSVCVYRCVCACASVHIYVQVCAHGRVHVCTCVPLCTYMCMGVCVCIYINAVCEILYGSGAPFQWLILSVMTNGFPMCSGGLFWSSWLSQHSCVNCIVSTFFLNNSVGERLRDKTPSQT